MKICDLHTGTGRLLRAAKLLRERWGDTNEEWNDSASRQFEESFLKPLGPEVQITLTAIQRLAEVLAEAEKACEDPDAGY